MRISDWSSDVCSSDLPTPRKSSCARAPFTGPLGSMTMSAAELMVGGCLHSGGFDRCLSFREVRCRHEDPDPGGHRYRSRDARRGAGGRSEEHTSELQSLMRISYAVFCLKKKINQKRSITSRSTNIINTKRT